METNNTETLESDEELLSVCVTLTDVGEGLERDVRFEIRPPNFGYSYGMAQSE